MSIETDILDCLKRKRISVFCIKDMISFGNYKSVAKAIERLTTKGNVVRVMSGIYYFPLFNKTFDLMYPVNIEDVIEALGRNNNWAIRETGSAALYKLGLDNQIPQKIVCLSSGPYRTYQTGNTTIEFKNASQKNFKFSKKSSLVVQALKAIGDKKVTFDEIYKMALALDYKEKETLLSDIQYTPVWMHQYIKEIGELKSE